MSSRIGIIGARGHVGSELIRLIAAHPSFELDFVASREREGRALSEYEPGPVGDLRYANPTVAEAAALGLDALVLALPNGKAAEVVTAVDAAAPDTLVLDLSADHRFDAAWYYGLPELTREHAEGARRISNPGCYATAMQLALAPLCDALSGPVQCFGVSGYSGAGSAPSERNDPDKLRDNLMPYHLVGHLHEREVWHQFGNAVEFMPAVGPWFRGITLTANVHLSRAFTVEQVRAIFRKHYDHEALVEITDAVPWVSHAAGRHGTQIGGFTITEDGRRLVLVCTLDNLLKGAATQALQNLNLAFGLPETTGIPT